MQLLLGCCFALHLIVWQAPSLCEFNMFNFKLSVITVCLSVIFLAKWGRGIFLTCMCHRLTKALETLLPRCVFSSSCLISSSDLPSSTQTFIKTHIKTALCSWSISVKCKVIVYCSCKCLDVRFITDNWRAFQWRLPDISLFSKQ